MDTDFENLVGHIKAAASLNDADARRIASEVYGDGVVTLAEADLLFDINDKLDGSDPAWDALFVTAVKDFVLTNHDPQNWVSEDEADWLISRVCEDGVVKLGNELDLLIAILRYAEGAPERLGRFVLQACCERMTAAGKATKDDVERVRHALYAMSSGGSIWVTASEADMLFRTNDAIAFAKNDASWNDLFAKAIANHLMSRAHPAPQSEEEAFGRERWLNDVNPSMGGFITNMISSFSKGNWFETVTSDPDKAEAARIRAREAAAREAEVVTEDESAWLTLRLGWDKSISPAERALIEFLKAEAPGFADGIAAAA